MVACLRVAYGLCVVTCGETLELQGFNQCVLVHLYDAFGVHSKVTKKLYSIGKICIPIISSPSGCIFPA